MNILALDTSSKHYSIALGKNAEVRFYRNVCSTKKVSDSLIPSIDHLLKKASMKLKDIDGFAVGIGPGAFTGLRVGLSTVKALVYSTQKPIVTISSLDILANTVRTNDAAICTVVDAKRKMIYGCQYQKRKGLLEKTGNYELTDIKDFLKSVKTKSIFIGDGANLYSADIRSSSKCSSIYQDRVGFPQVKYVFPLVYEKFQRKAYEDPAALIPIYLYPEDCQVKKKAV